MTIIEVGGELVLNDGTYLVTATEGNALRLQNTHTEEESVIQIADIPQRLRTASTLPDVDITALASLLKTRNRRRYRSLQRFQDHIVEMLTGTRYDNAGNEVHRPEYDPSRTSFNQRVAAKSAELVFSDTPASPSTLKRKARAYQRGGSAALIDGRSVRPQSSMRKLTPELYEALAHIVKTQTKKTTQRKKALAAQVRGELRRSHPDYDLSTLPSERTLYRYLDIMSNGKHTTGNAKTRRTSANSPGGPATRERPMYPGQEVQIDSNKLDILILDDDGNASRPTLTVMLDVGTRCVVALTLRLTATKGVDQAFILVQSVLPRGSRPGDDAIWELTRLLHPDLELWTKKETDEATRMRPFIYPECIVIDNGADFRSAIVQSTAAKLGMGISIARPYSPTDKAIIERFFLTLNDGFLAKLPGYVGGAVSERGEKIEQENLLTLPVLAELLEEWVSIVYQNQRHQGLRAPMSPRIALSPNQMYEAMATFSGKVPIPVTRDEYIGLLPDKSCVIGAEGVEVNYRKYNSVELQALRHLPSAYPSRNRKWEVRFNPYNPLFVWVRNPRGGWIEGAWRESETYRQPFASAVWTKAVQAAKANGDLDRVTEYAQLLSSLPAAKADARKQKTRSKAALEQAAAEGTPMPTGSVPLEKDDPDLAQVPDRDAKGRPIVHLSGAHSKGPKVP